MLATAGLDRTGARWSLGGHRAIAVPLTGQQGVVAEAAYTPDGRLLTAAADGTVAERDGDTGRVLRAFELATTSPRVTASAGRMLASTTLGRSTTRLWEVPAGRPIGALLVGGRVPYTRRTASIEHFSRSRPAFAPDGRRLATVGADGAALLWDLTSAAWRRAACSVAGRDLTAAEWREHLRDRHPVALCAG